MSTRCVINFCSGATVCAKIYRHSDGYPEGDHGVLADLQRFFGEVERQTYEKRFDQPDYLAAKFVVWQAGQIAHGSAEYVRKCKGTDWNGRKEDPENLESGSLAFLGVGVCMEDPGDIEHSYFVDCGTRERPAVRHESSR